MKKRIIHPRLAAGTCGITYLLFFSILEKITSYPFISTHVVKFCVIFVPIGIIVYNKFYTTYDREKNDDKLFTIISIIVLGLFVILVFFI